MIDTPNKNYLSNDVVIKGSIKFANEFIFDGNLEGDITSANGVLTVGENANVRGDVKSKIVIKCTVISPSQSVANCMLVPS
jgi:cytoskeletal protein CcmA (bactofilin family)